MPVLQTQSVSGQETTQLNLTVPGCAAGSRLVVTTAIWAVGGVSTPLSVSSSPGLTWSEDVVGAYAQLGEFDQGQQVSIWSAPVPSAGAYAIQADFNASSWGKLVALEVSGILSGAVLDRTAANSANNASDFTPTVGPTAALSQAEEFVVAVLGASTGSGSAADIGAALASGWTRAFYDGDANTSAAIAVDHRNVSSTAAVSGNWGTVASHCDAWSAALAAYKATSAVGPPINTGGGTLVVAVSAFGGAASLGPVPPASVTAPVRAFSAAAALFITTPFVNAPAGAPANATLPANQSGPANSTSDASGTSTTAPMAFLAAQASLLAPSPPPSAVFVTLPARFFAAVTTFAPVPPASSVPANPSPAILAASASFSAPSPPPSAVFVTAPARAFAAVTTFAPVPPGSTVPANPSPALLTASASFSAPSPPPSAVFVTLPARSFTAVTTFAPVPPASAVPANPSPALLAAQAVFFAPLPLVVSAGGGSLGPAYHLRRLRVVAGSRLLAAAPPNAVPITSPLEPAYPAAVETFYDDFAGRAIDGRKWSEVFSGAGENFIFDPAMLSVSNGLTIRTRWDGTLWRTGGIRRGTSATNFAGFRYGQVSVKARVDPGKGYGPTLALWPTANGGAAGAEIDVLLAPSAGKTSGWNRVRAANGVTQDQAEFSADLGQWHVHTARWEPGTVTFYLDGVPLRTVTSVAVDVPMALMLQGFVAAAGNAFYGGAPNEFSEKQIEVAYVRVSQLPGGPGLPDDTPKVLSIEPAGPGALTEAAAGEGVEATFVVKSTGIASLTYVVVRSDGTWREPRATQATGGEVTIRPRFFAVGDFLRAMKADDFGVFKDSTAVTSFTSPQPSTGRITEIGAFTGAWAVDGLALDQWMGEPMDGFLAYTAGWQGWDGLRPEAALGDPTLLAGTRRRLLWSIMMIPDGSVGESEAWYAEVASGARNGLFNQIGQELIAYHDSIGDTKPIYVRSTWEVPGEWFNWNVAAANDPNTFKAAWAQFATALRAGRPRIKTVWDFNSDRGPVEHLYPGDQHIDVIGQDIYWIHDLQGTDPVAAFHRSRHGYSRGLQWNLDFCREKGKPLAISEFGIKLDGIDVNQLDCAVWFREFFAFVDECNQPGNPGMAYVTWWDEDAASVGKFTHRAPQTQQNAVRNIFRPRLIATP